MKGILLLAFVLASEAAAIDGWTVYLRRTGPIRIGMSLSDVRRAIEDPNYLEYRGRSGADRGYGLIFETDGRQVTRFRAGAYPSVGWVEGCS